MSTPTDDQLEASYIHLRAKSNRRPPSRQAVATAVAWGRQLVDSLATGSSAQGPAAQREEGPHG